MPRPHAVRRQTSVTLASRVRRGCWMNRPAGTRGEATYTALTLRSACSHSSCKLPMLGVGGLPRVLLGVQGAFSHVRRPPFTLPQELAGAFRSRPCTLTTKREGPCPSFLDYPPRSSDGAAMPRPHAVRRQTSVTRASRVRRGCWMNRPAGTRGEATYTTYTLRSACSHSSCKLPMLGVEGDSPRVLLGVQGGPSLT